MAPRIGFEPITKWLTATYSTIELPRNVKDDVFPRNTFTNNISIAFINTK